MRIHVQSNTARADYLHQWYKGAYRTERSEARTLNREELIAFAAQRNLAVAESVSTRRSKWY
jgi:hypothetical protein